MKSGFAIRMMYENDPAAGGCDFGLFFSSTPQDLITDGLYKALALAFYPEPFRAVSCCLIARALGANKAVGVSGLKSRLSTASNSWATARRSAKAAAEKPGETKPGLTV